MAIEVEQLYSGRGQIVPQHHQALAQALARLPVETIAPQEAGELVAPRPVLRMKREVGRIFILSVHQRKVRFGAG